MTFDACTFSPMRKPPRKTAAASRTQAGHTAREGEPRPLTPIHTPRRTTQMSAG